MINGPGSPSVKANMIITIEHHTDWIMDLLDHLAANDLDRIEATKPAQSDWVEHAREVAEATLMPVADSWYVGANIPGKKRVYMPYFGGFERYWKILRRSRRRRLSRLHVIAVQEHRVPHRASPRSDALMT